MPFNIESYLRKLAKHSKWQVIYSASKEINVGIFKNNFDYSYSQILFLNFLAFYNGLNMDIYLGEVSDIVLKDHIYEDAWNYYKSMKDKKDKFSVLKKPVADNVESNPRSTKWIFERPKKEFK